MQQLAKKKRSTRNAVEGYPPRVLKPMIMGQLRSSCRSDDHPVVRKGGLKRALQPVKCARGCFEACGTSAFRPEALREQLKHLQQSIDSITLVLLTETCLRTCDCAPKQVTKLWTGCGGHEPGTTEGISLLLVFCLSERLNFKVVFGA